MQLQKEKGRSRRPSVFPLILELVQPADAFAFRFVRQPRRLKPPRPDAKSARVAGRGVTAGDAVAIISDSGANWGAPPMDAASVRVPNEQTPNTSDKLPFVGADTAQGLAT